MMSMSGRQWIEMQRFLLLIEHLRFLKNYFVEQLVVALLYGAEQLKKGVIDGIGMFVNEHPRVGRAGADDVRLLAKNAVILRRAKLI